VAFAYRSSIKLERLTIATTCGPVFALSGSPNVSIASQNYPQQAEHPLGYPTYIDSWTLDDEMVLSFLVIDSPDLHALEGQGPFQPAIRTVPDILNGCAIPAF